VGFDTADNPKMDTAKVIARNLAHLMEQSNSLTTITAVAKASGVGFGTVQRARNGDGNLTVQNLEMIAAAFRRKAVDLLADPEESSVDPAATIASGLVVHERRAEYMTDDERLLIEAFRIADEGARRALLLLARDSLDRFGRRRTNHQQ
jgi:transcriptional regulator with XRE-family HTH domain